MTKKAVGGACLAGDKVTDLREELVHICDITEGWLTEYCFLVHTLWHDGGC